MPNRIPLGVYVGNPNGSDATAEAAFDNTYRDLASTIGQAPEFIDTFIDFSRNWSDLVGSAQWNARSQSQSPVAHNLTPVIAVPLGTVSDNGANTLQQIAAGAHDDAYRGIAEAYRDAGYTNVYMRIGWEMDGDYMRWSMGNTTDSVNTWKASFAHVADVLHSVSGIKVNVVWNPGLSNNNQVDVTQSYPGDDKVDVIGLDIYSPTYKYDSSVSNSQYYNYPSASQYHSTGTDSAQWGLAQTMSFASAHGKSVGIAETGVGVGDNNDLPATIAADFTAPGAPQAAFVNVWDVTTGEGDWQFTNGHNNGAAQAWAAAFAGGGSNNNGSVPAATGSATSAATISSADPGSSASIDPASVGAYAGPVQFLSSDANRAEAVWGPMDVAGDAGGDLYVVHSGDSNLTVENFSASKGDVLNISSSLHDMLGQNQVNGGVILSFTGDASHTGEIFLKGVSSVDPSNIVWG